MNLKELARYGKKGNRDEVHEDLVSTSHTSKGKYIKGYYGLYSITKNGDVYSYRNNPKGTIVKPKIDSTGHKIVTLEDGINTKTKYVYILVAEAYVCNTHGFTRIVWIDGNKNNINYTNLLWVSDNEFDTNRTAAYKGVKKNGSSFTAVFTLMLGEFTTPQEAALARRVLRDSLRNLPKDHPAKLLLGDKLRGSNFISGMD